MTLPSIRSRNTEGLHVSVIRWFDELRNAIASDANATVPTGALQGTLSSSEPATGWLLCNGQSVSKHTYAALFAVIGTEYGSTATNFTLPNLGGRVLVGADTIPLLDFGGSPTVTLTEAQLPAHSHTVPDHSHTAAVVDAGGAMMGAGADGAASGNTSSVIGVIPCLYSRSQQFKIDIARFTLQRDIFACRVGLC